MDIRKYSMYMSPRNILKFFVGFVVFLAMLFLTNIYICNLFPIPQKGYGEWAGTPGGNRELILGPENFSAIHHYNSFGFRGEDFSVAPTTTVRVTCVGDSFTEGYGAQENETWPMVLSRILGSSDGEALNLGRAGSQTDIYADIINKVAIPLKPTDIVVSIITSDFRYGFELPERLHVNKELANPFMDNRNAILKVATKMFPGWMYLLDRMRGRYTISSGTSWGVTCGKVILKDALKEIPAWCNISHVQAKATLEERRKLVNPEVMKAVEYAGFNPYLLKVDLVQSYYTYRATLSDMGASEEDLRECTMKWMKWYSSVCSERGIRAWILYFPLPPLVSDAPFGIYEDSFYKDAPKIYGDTSVRDMLADACKDNDVRFIDATETLMSYTNKIEPAYYRWAPHPTPKGYELVGKLVAKEIGKMKDETRKND